MTVAQPEAGFVVRHSIGSIVEGRPVKGSISSLYQRAERVEAICVSKRVQNFETCAVRVDGEECPAIVVCSTLHARPIEGAIARLQ